jgi:hypothetical protein
VRELTFKGFLESYVKYLSGGGSLALPHLDLGGWTRWASC